MNEIKTSEQVRAELEDKKIAKTYLSEFENGIKKELDDFKAVLFNFKPNYEVNHVLDVNEIKSLKNTINEYNLKLQKFSIPEKIEILEKKENKITFTDATTKWLTWFCGIAFIITVVASSYGYIAYRDVAKSNAESFEKGITEGVFKGRNQIYSVSTEKGKERIDKQYPEWRTKK